MRQAPHHKPLVARQVLSDHGDGARNALAAHESGLHLAQADPVAVQVRLRSTRCQRLLSNTGTFSELWRLSTARVHCVAAHERMHAISCNGRLRASRIKTLFMCAFVCPGMHTQRAQDAQQRTSSPTGPT